MALPLAQVPVAPSIATPIPVPQAPPATPIPVPPVNAGFDPDAYLKEVATTAVKPEADAFDPDSYVADEAKKYVDDDDFDPLTLAYEQPDKKEFAKEIEFRKSQRPMTGARAGKAVKNFGKAIPGIVEDFGKGFGNIIADSYIQATDDNPANVERAKTQQLARAQLIESHGGAFLNKLFGPDSWIGSHIAHSPESIVKAAPLEREQIQKMYGHAEPGSEIDQIRVAELARVDKEEAEAQAKIAHGPETPRQKSDRMFEEKLAQVHKEREILKGVPQPDGIVAELTKGAGQATHRLITGEAAPEDMYHVEDTFKTGAQLAAMNAPIDEEAIRTGAVTADPINLAPLNLPKMVPIANKIGGALLKAPAYVAGKIAENTPEVISAAAKKKLLGAGATAASGAVAYEALKDPASAAKHLAAAGVLTAGVAGAKYFGRVMDVAGSKMMNPKFVSAAEKAGAQAAMDIEKAGGSKVSQFFNPAMNKADLERAITRPLQGAVSAPIAMAPLNAAISDTPEEFAALSGTATGFGLFGGATAYNPLKGFHPETVAAVDSLLRDQGAKKKYGTALDAQHEAFMEKAPEGVRDSVNSYRGFFDGFKLSNGREPQIYVLPADQFGAEVSKRRPDVTPDHAAKQRGFIGKDGAILINGDYGGEAPGILGHEAGGHAAMSIMEVLLPEVSKSMEAAARNGLTDGKGNPTKAMREFVNAYNKEFDPTGKRKEIKTENQAINEWLAEQARAVLDGQGPAKYAAGNSVRAKIADNLADHFRSIFGTKRAFDRTEVPGLARQYRDLLFQLGRLRGQEGPEAAPESAPGEPAAAPAADPAAPAGARPAAEPAPAASGDRATVAAALRSLFGVKQAEADAMAAAATGSTVEEMIASAAQAKSKAVAGSRTTAPAAQPAPLQPAGQLAGVAAAAEPAGVPAGQLAGFGEPAAAAPAAKPKIFVRRMPDGTFVDRQGNPVDPRTGVAPEAPNLERGGAAATPEAPARPVVTPEDLTGRVQAAEDAARTAEAGKNRRTPESRDKATAQAVKEARIQALLDAAHESAPDEGHLQRREEFGTAKYTGRIDESIPAHRMLLDELGVSEGGRANIDTLSANLGKPVFIRYKSAAKEGSSEAAQASGQVDRTGKQRAKEYKAETVGARIEDAQAGDVNTGVEQTKSFYPLGFRVNPSTGSVTVTGFSPQRLLSNVGKIVDFMRGKGRETGYKGADDPAVNDDMQGYAQNHANGYKGDGSGPIAGETPTPNYEPYIIDGTRFDVLNAAMGNESAKTPKSDREGAKARAGDLQDFAAANDTLLNEGGETNALRQWLNESGFEFRNEGTGEVRTGTKEVLEPTIESLRVDPELMREISTEAPEGEASLRPTGVADPSGMTAAGIPKARNVAAGFMPGQGAEKGQLSEFGGDRDESSIKSKIPQTDELGFYSRLRQHVDEADFGTSKPKAAQHWLGVIEKWAKGASTPTLGVQSRGIARDELEWSGVKEWLKAQGSKPIKKADVLAFIDGNGIKVSEVQKGSGKAEGDAYWMDDEVQDLSHAFEDDHNGAWEINAWPNEEGGESKSLAAIFQPKNEKAYKIKNEGGEFVLYSGDGRNYSEEIGSFKTRQEAEDALNEEREAEDSADPVFEIHDSSGGSSYQVDTAKTFEEAVRKAREIASKRLRELNEEAGGEDAGDTQFSGYKLDGGTNYKEILLTLPQRSENGDSVGRYKELVAKVNDESITPDEQRELDSLERQRRQGGGMNDSQNNFTDSHWEEPNVVAHFRQQDFERDTYDIKSIRNVERKIMDALGVKSASNLASGAASSALKKGAITALEASQYAHFKGYEDYATGGVDTKAGTTEKVRHIDEIQSDWHQKGRERGYEGDKPSEEETALRDQLKDIENRRVAFLKSHGFKSGGEMNLELRKLRDEYNQKNDAGAVSGQGIMDDLGIPEAKQNEYWKNLEPEERTAAIYAYREKYMPKPKALTELESVVEKHSDFRDEQSAVQDKLKPFDASQKVPDAPFKKTWAQLAFKRALKLAVEDGMDRLTWSTGEQNIEHYKRALVAEVDKITWTHPPKVDYKIVTLDTNSSGMLRFNVAPDGTISESGGGHVATQFEGKKLGDVIGNDNAKKILDPGEGQMNGEGMQVGGEGMRTFYDEILPQFAKKHVEKWGSKVEQVMLPNGQTVHSVKITPEMRAAVEQGQPMFMPGKGPEKAAGDLSDFGSKEEPKGKVKVERWNEDSDSYDPWEVADKAEAAFKSSGINVDKAKELNQVAFGKDGEPIGATFRKIEEKSAEDFGGPEDQMLNVYEFDIGIKPEEQGGTVGYMLTKKAIDDARESGADIMRNWVINKKQAEMMERLFGFEHQSEPDDRTDNPHGYYSTDMTLWLKNPATGDPIKSGRADLPGGFMPGKGADKPAGDLSGFGDGEPSIESKVEWAQPKRAKSAGDVVVNVKTGAFDEAFQKDHGFYIDKDGNGEIKGRRERFKEFLKEGKAIEMPEVVITKEGTAAFVNGRHRFSVMRDSGVESIPMSMDETSALRAQTLGMTVDGESKGQLGSFMPGETGRAEFDVKEKKPVDERRARLMADMQAQAKWLGERAKEKGFDSIEDLMTDDFDGYNDLAKQWRDDHPRFNAAGEQLFMPGDAAKKTRSEELKADLEGKGYKFDRSASSDGDNVVYHVMKGDKEAGRMEIVKDRRAKDAEVVSIHVFKEHRGSGIAELMYREAGKELQKQGFKTITGEAVSLAPVNLRKKVFGKLDHISDAFGDIPESELAKRLPGVSETMGGGQSAVVRNRIDPRAQFMPGKLEGATPEERDANFDKWTGSAPVIRVGDSLHDVEPGQPVVIEGFHGTTHDFMVVDTSKANIENDWGKGFYVTNTPEDVESNYAGEGPDLTQRIEKRAEQIHSELGFADATISDLAEFKGESDAKEWWDSMTTKEQDSVRDEFQKANTITMEEARARAKEELTTHGGSTMKVFVKLENPLKLGEGSGREDYWDAETPMDEETGDPDGEPTGKLVDFIEALREVSNDYDEADIDSADDLNQLIWDGGTTPSKALAAAKEALQYATDPETGDLAASEILRAAVERMGYDGIIDETVNDKFGSNKATGKAMTGMDDYTFHVIAFRPESVKSATGNRGTFDGSNPDMTMMPGSGPRRTWFVRGGKRVYHNRGDAGKFTQKPTLAKFPVGGISSKKQDDDAKAQLETFK